jgi:hypothetical protein
MIKAIEYKGIEFDVEFDYLPPSPMVMYYKDGTGHPGDEADIDIQYIKHKGTCFYDILEENIDDIEVLVWKEMEEDFYNY